MTDRINITVPVKALCDTLGVDYRNVKRITLEPRKASVEAYKVDDEGNKYVDTVTNEPAVETRDYLVET